MVGIYHRTDHAHRNKKANRYAPIAQDKIRPEPLNIAHHVRFLPSQSVAAAISALDWLNVLSGLY